MVGRKSARWAIAGLETKQDPLDVRMQGTIDRIRLVPGAGHTHLGHTVVQ